MVVHFASFPSTCTTRQWLTFNCCFWEGIKFTTVSGNLIIWCQPTLIWGSYLLLCSLAKFFSWGKYVCAQSLFRQCVKNIALWVSFWMQGFFSRSLVFVFLHHFPTTLNCWLFIPLWQRAVLVVVFGVGIKFVQLSENLITRCLPTLNHGIVLQTHSQSQPLHSPWSLMHLYITMQKHMHTFAYTSTPERCNEGGLWEELLLQRGGTREGYEKSFYSRGVELGRVMRGASTPERWNEGGLREELLLQRGGTREGYERSFYSREVERGRGLREELLLQRGGTRERVTRGASTPEGWNCLSQFKVAS